MEHIFYGVDYSNKQWGTVSGVNNIILNLPISTTKVFCALAIDYGGGNNAVGMAINSNPISIYCTVNTHCGWFCISK